MKRRILGIAVSVIAAVGLYSGSMARACGLDGIPSLVADGRHVRTNQQVPVTSAQLAAFTPFVSAQSFAVGHAITLSEDRVEVATSLNAASMRRAWRWRFSDGSVAYGWTVRHAFKRAGNWQVRVDAYYPGDGKWYQFDSVSLTVTNTAHR